MDGLCGWSFMSRWAWPYAKPFGQRPSELRADLRKLAGSIRARKTPTADRSHACLEGNGLCLSSAQQARGEEPVHFSFRERRRASEQKMSGAHKLDLAERNAEREFESGRAPGPA